MKRPNWTRRHTITMIYIIGFILYGLVFWKIMEILGETRRNTDAIKASQVAFQQAQIEQQKDSDRKLNILICMALVPQAERTTNTAEDCRKRVDTGETFFTSLETPDQPTTKQTPQNNPHNTSNPPPQTKKSKSLPERASDRAKGVLNAGGKIIRSLNPF